MLSVTYMFFRQNIIRVNVIMLRVMAPLVAAGFEPPIIESSVPPLYYLLLQVFVVMLQCHKYFLLIGVISWKASSINNFTCGV
jgi:hypothetical protein